MVGLSDGQGDYVNCYYYVFFGEDVFEQEQVVNQFEFVGQFGVMEEVNGFDFMWVRFYDGEIGWFVFMDFIGLNGGDENLYWYVGNGLINAIDLEGLIIVCFIKFIFIIFIGVGFIFGFVKECVGFSLKKIIFKNF